MHHTDYSSNLRNAQHKTIKNLSRRRSSHDFIEDKSKDLLRAAVAAVLVLVALLQMDPANAQDTQDVPGYGTVKLEGIKAEAISSELKMVIHDERLSLNIKQTFNNPSTRAQTGEYWFALPTNAKVLGWEIDRVPTDCKAKNAHRCLAQTITHVNPSKSHINATNNMLAIPLGEMQPNQLLSINLNIALPTTNNESFITTSLPTENGLDKAQMNSVSIAAELIGSVASSQPFGVVQPLY